MTAELDDAFRTVTRIRIAAFLSGCDEAEFRAVQEYCDLSPSNLSKNASALEEKGYVAVRKGYAGKTPRTWLALTDAGRGALVRHMAALQEIADSAARHA
ncbi:MULTISPECIES: transcriptional regulator [unclassified Kitasatospora]|uniref:transcriptional regulator n=1 Tax=unclassified Kitasatospora TaxID=2633591 RepID=UPI001AE020F5|nr:transcriptional regulator [Kitasatospora sp. RG8]MBP0452190.1 transcriptional regulator [Kitasatospora sp. RG8]